MRGPRRGPRGGAGPGLGTCAPGDTCSREQGGRICTFCGGERDRERSVGRAVLCLISPSVCAVCVDGGRELAESKYLSLHGGPSLLPTRPDSDREARLHTFHAGSAKSDKHTAGA